MSASDIKEVFSQVMFPVVLGWAGLAGLGWAGWAGLGGEKDKPPPRLKWFLARWVHFVLRREPGTEGEVLLA